MKRHPGDLGRIYGVQWRKWRKPVIRINKVILQNHDQLLELIEGIKSDPYGRRHIITAWNPGELDLMALPPCHCLFQFYVAHGKLSCQLYQRSADMFLGVPFNIASYALLTLMVAQVCNLKPGDFVHTFGDTHLYLNHLDQAREQLITLRRVIYQCMQLAAQRGRLIYDAADKRYVEFGPNLAAIPMANEGYEQMQVGDPANLDSSPLWAEIQPTAWVIDGGLVFVALYAAALLTVLWQQLRLVRRLPGAEDRAWAAAVIAVNAGTMALVFSFVPFTTQVGLQFWFLEGALHGAVRDSLETRA